MLTFIFRAFTSISGRDDFGKYRYWPNKVAPNILAKKKKKIAPTSNVDTFHEKLKLLLPLH